MKKAWALLLCLAAGAAYAAADTNSMLTPAQYNMMEPYLNKTMRERFRPADAKYTTSSNQAIARAATDASAVALSNFVRPNAGVAKSERRRVVARSGANTARSVAPTATTPSIVRAAAAPVRAATSGGGRQRQVVARSRSASRLQGSNSEQRNSTGEVPAPKVVTTGDITPERCLANYSECMDNYCHRPDAKYDRCYCSAKLAQVDAEYQPAIDDLVRRITILKNGGDIEGGMTQQEINDYWDETFGGSDSMASLDDALNISWAGTESSARGQNAFVTGDTYCKQNLSGCFYMAENMKSMYRTTIGKDCKTYETYLQRMKYAAEQIVDSLQ